MRSSSSCPGRRPRCACGSSGGGTGCGCRCRTTASASRASTSPASSDSSSGSTGSRTIPGRASDWRSSAARSSGWAAASAWPPCRAPAARSGSSSRPKADRSGRQPRGRHVLLLAAEDLEELIGREMLLPEEDLPEQERRLAASHRLLLPERVVDLGARDVAEPHGDLAEEAAAGRIRRQLLEPGFLDAQRPGELLRSQMSGLDQEPSDGFFDVALGLPVEALLKLLLLEKTFLERDLTEEMGVLWSVHPYSLRRMLCLSVAQNP